MPVPSSNSATENVLDAPARPDPVHASAPNCGTLIQLTLNALMFANPNACTGNVPQFAARAFGFKSVHAGAIRGGPVRKSGTVGVLDTSPIPNVMFPFEFRKNPFHTQPAAPTGPPNTNSKPPLSGPVNTGLPATTPGGIGDPLSSSSPRNGVF